MKKKTENMKEYSYFSEKCNRIVPIYTVSARILGNALENSKDVIDYETLIPFSIVDTDISTEGIRPSYVAADWFTDFSVNLADGNKKIIESVMEDDLLKDSVLQQLELSRRYWLSKGFDWQIFVVRS